MTDNTNDGVPATNGAEEKARAPRQPRQRGPPEDGIPSKNKVMVANLPYDLSEEKVNFTGSLTFTESSNIVTIAQGTLLCVQPYRCQDRSSTYRPLHGQEAASPQRAP